MIRMFHELYDTKRAARKTALSIKASPGRPSHSQEQRTRAIDTAFNVSLYKNLSSLFAGFVMVILAVFASIATLGLPVNTAHAVPNETICNTDILERIPLTIMNSATMHDRFASLPTPVQILSSDQDDMKVTRLTSMTTSVASANRFAIEDYRAGLVSAIAKEYEGGFCIEFPTCIDENDSAKLTLKYPLVGLYKGKQVGALISYHFIHSKNDDTPFTVPGLVADYRYSAVQIGDSLFSGIDMCNIDYVDSELSLFYCESGEKISLEAGSLITIGSLNYWASRNESEYVYVSDDDTIKTQTPTIEEPTKGNTTTAPHETGSIGYGFRSDDWVDSIDHENFYRQSVSLYQTGNAFKFRVGGGYNLTTHTASGSQLWWSLSSASIATSTPVEPTKEVDKSAALIGDTIRYSISQVVHDAGIDIQSKYNSLVIYDLLPEQVDYVADSAIIYQELPNEARVALSKDAGKFNYDSLEHSLSYSFSKDFLATMPMKAETYTVVFDSIVNETVSPGEAFDNKATVYINDFGQDARVQVIPYEPGKPVKTSSPASGSFVSNTEEITYSVSYTNTTEVALKVKLSDVVPDNTSYKEGSLVIDSLSVVPDALNDDVLNGSNKRETSAVWNSLAPYETASYSFTVLVDSTTPPDTVLTNKAELEINDGPRIETNPIEHYLGTPLVKVTKSSNPESGSTVYAGDEIQYHLHVQNHGTVRADMVAVFDRIPSFTSFVSVENRHSATYNEEVNGIGWLIESIAPGEETTLVFTVKVYQGIPTKTMIENSATYALGEKDIPTKPLGTATNTTVHEVVEWAVAGTPPQGGGPMVKTGDAQLLIIIAIICLAFGGLLAFSFLMRRRRYSENEGSSKKRLGRNYISYRP